jgi:hypothetical protein
MKTLTSSQPRNLDWQNKNYTKRIPCPFGESEIDGHQAIVYMNGHLWAGIIECQQCEVNESCEHKTTHTQKNEVTAFIGEKDVSYNQNIEVCDACDCTVEVL